MLTGEKKKTAIQYTKQLASVMNLDDALREFFEKYKKRPDFNSTIFIITGDHSMPEIALQSKIDRYHVPLLIYSPLINKPTTFRNTVSNFDIAPSILAYYKANHNLNIPKNITWIGKGLKEGASKSSYGVPIMQSKYQLEDYVFLNYHLSNGKLFKLDHKLEEDIYFNKEIESEIKARFDLFNKKNKVFISQNKLLPDSAYYNFFNY